jgi:hypothetical protein
MHGAGCWRGRQGGDKRPLLDRGLRQARTPAVPHPGYTCTAHLLDARVRQAVRPAQHRAAQLRQRSALRQLPRLRVAKPAPAPVELQPLQPERLMGEVNVLPSRLSGSSFGRPPIRSTHHFDISILPVWWLDRHACLTARGAKAPSSCLLRGPRQARCLQGGIWLVTATRSGPRLARDLTPRRTHEPRGLPPKLDS